MSLDITYEMSYCNSKDWFRGRGGRGVYPPKIWQAYILCDLFMNSKNNLELFKINNWTKDDNNNIEYFKNKKDIYLQQTLVDTKNDASGALRLKPGEITFFIKMYENKMQLKKSSRFAG